MNDIIRTPDGGELNLDLVSTALSSRRARLVCYYLMADDVEDINELFLAREVAAWETGADPPQVRTETVMQVLEELQEGTLPRLDEAGLIEYDTGNGIVRYGDPSEPIERVLVNYRSIEQPE